MKLRVAAARRARGAGRTSWPATPVEDVSVEDPPLEEVIAEVFSQSAKEAERHWRSSGFVSERMLPSPSRHLVDHPADQPSKSGWSTGATSPWAR